MARFLVALLFLAHASVASAQSLGTFRWQLQPYCNVVTLGVTETGGVYTLDGFDDQCGAATRAPVTGTAVPNPDGTIEIGLNIVNSPGAAPLHVAVPLSLATLGGTVEGQCRPHRHVRARPERGHGRRAAAGLGRDWRRGGGSGAGATARERELPDRTAHRAHQPGRHGRVRGRRHRRYHPGDRPGGGLLAAATSGAVTLGLRNAATGDFDFSNDSGLTGQAPPEFLLGPVVAGGPVRASSGYPGKAAIRAGRVTRRAVGRRQRGRESAAFGSTRGVAASPASRRVEATPPAGVARGHRHRGQHASGDWKHRARQYRRAGTGVLHLRRCTSDAADISSAPNQFIVSASGGRGVLLEPTLTSGVELAPGPSAWSSVSDVNMKEHFRDLDGDDVLAKLARMPIREWNYKAQDAAIRHVGPTAQDFHAAFGLGEDPLRISTIDADGIALRAVQALEARTREGDDALARENAELKAELAALRERLERLERTPR